MILDETKIREIGPYPDNEINDALKRLTKAKEFPHVAKFVFPDKEPADVASMLLEHVHNSDDFQIRFMYGAVRGVVKNSAAGLTQEGFDKLDPNTPYLFIANHRDIVLDSAILQVLLYDAGLPRSEITFGSNLMMSPFIIDFGKINKMFTVKRGGTRQELFENSKMLSAYIRYTITQKKNSAWIAQRNGRTKDGFDKTEEGLLKMLNMSGEKSFSENFSQLNIVPLAISYEYEPCGLSKTNEMFVSRHGEYVKQPGEDLVSIITGFTQYKGHIHVCAGQPLTNCLKEFDDTQCKNENIRHLSELIDKQIYQNYRLWPTNYIAFDLLNKTTQFAEKYSQTEREKFEVFVTEEISKLQGDSNQLREIYLEMYANPLKNQKSI